MKPPTTSNKGAPNPYARRTPWGRVQAAPFKLGVGPGSAPVSGEPAAPKPPPLRQPRGGALPGPGEGILGGSPLMPARSTGPASPLIQPAEAKATPVHTPKPVPKPTSAPAPAVVAPAASLARTPPAEPPPPIDASELIERLAAIEAETRPTGRRLLIAGVAVGVIALIGVAALVLSQRDQPDEGTPEAAAVAPAAAPESAPPATSVPDAAGLPAPPIYRATLPPPVGATTSPSAAAPAPAPATAPVVAEPVLAAPEPAVIPSVVEAPAPKPAPPPPAPPRQAVDPDAPFVLRKGED